MGNNGVGKSTIIEALSLAMGYGLNKLEITSNLFHIDCQKEFLKTKEPPLITIEVVFSGEKDEFSGTNNTLHQYLRGLQLKICFDDTYGDLFTAERAECTQIPCEYYKVERFWFSDLAVKQQLMPYNVLLVDSSSAYFNASTNQYIANFLKKCIVDEDLVKIQSSLRHLRERFEGEQKIGELNDKLKNEIPKLKVSIDVTSDLIFRNILCAFIEDIPMSQIGQGDLCILKTMLSIAKTLSTPKDKVIIIEEPETHLSHTKMYELIRKIEDNLDKTKTQLIITTHNSFVANKLGLSNLLLIENNNGFIELRKMQEENTKLYSFFTKVSNYPTLRLILCKSAVLVEGPTDEMIVTYYYKKKYNKHPFDDGIELISVEGVKFKGYVDLAKSFSKKIAIITDNDGLSRDELLEKRGLKNLPDSIRLFTEEDLNSRTLEPSFVSKNKADLQKLSEDVRKNKVNNDTEDDLVKFMMNNKAEWAYRILTKVDSVNYEVPEYIHKAFDWLLSNGE